jgi:hypothetical protein
VSNGLLLFRRDMVAAVLKLRVHKASRETSQAGRLSAPKLLATCKKPSCLKLEPDLLLISGR